MCNSNLCHSTHLVLQLSLFTISSFASTEVSAWCSLVLWESLWSYCCSDCIGLVLINRPHSCGLSPCLGKSPFWLVHPCARVWRCFRNISSWTDTIWCCCLIIKSATIKSPVSEGKFGLLLNLRFQIGQVLGTWISFNSLNRHLKKEFNDTTANKYLL